MTTTATLTSGTVMDKAASLNNDTAKSNYTYTVQIPFLNMALQELQEIFELNNVPVTDTVSAALDVVAGIDHISFTAQGSLVLPDDFIEPKQLWEREHGIDPYVPMTRVDNLPRYLEGQEINQFVYYVWQEQEIRFFPANQDNDILMDYTRDLFSAVTDENAALNIINGASFLEYKTAALLSRYIGMDKPRADMLDGEALLALDRAAGIGTKGRQSIMIRRRPFRSSYKRRSYM